MPAYAAIRKKWVRVLTAAEGQLIPLHRPERRARDLTQLLRDQPELKEVIIDRTERRLPRPQHRARQRDFDSGRKKRHAVKNVIVVGRRKALWCSPMVPARHHDKKVADQARLRLPEQVYVWGTADLKGGGNRFRLKHHQR